MDGENGAPQGGGKVGVGLRRTFRWTLRGVWLLTGVLLLLCLFVPFRFGALRLTMLAGTALFWAGAVGFAWRRPLLRAAALLPALLVAAVALLPGRPADPERLRAAYLAALRGYSGTPYVWGGETHIGIDCSGLVRGGMIEACLKEGVATANPGLLRAAASLWWHDCSAKALGEEYRGETRRLLDARSLNELDYARLSPGDVAVTAAGVHTLAYLGDRTWIQADPGAYRVVSVRAPAKDGWFVQGVRILRWSRLATPANDGLG
jgi:hypothetical protein